MIKYLFGFLFVFFTPFIVPVCWEGCTYIFVPTLPSTVFSPGGVLGLYLAFFQPLFLGEILLKSALAIWLMNFIVLRNLSKDIAVALSVALVVLWSGIIYFSYTKFTNTGQSVMKEQNAKSIFSTQISLGMKKDEVLAILRKKGIEYEDITYSIRQGLGNGASLVNADVVILNKEDNIFFDLERKILIYYAIGHSMSLVEVAKEQEFLKNNFPVCTQKEIAYENTSTTCLKAATY